MFLSESNGYNKNEVDRYIAKLKSEYEATIMEEKLKLIESQRKLLDCKKYVTEIERKQKNIVNMLETYKKFQDEGNKNLEALRLEQFNLIYQNLSTFLNELKIDYPEIENSNLYKQLMKDVSKILKQNEKNNQVIKNTVSDNDSMRILLSKMQQYKKGKNENNENNVKEVYIERNSKNLIKPVTDMELHEGEKYDNLVDKFLSTKPEENERTMKIQSSGFDLKEAVSPTMSLSEIMKAFDFYSDDGEE